MKTKLTLFVITLLCSVSLMGQEFDLCSHYASPNYDSNHVEYDGLTYNLYTDLNIVDAAEENGMKGSFEDGNCVIPATITYNGTAYPVVALESNCFSSVILTTITLGENITTIGQDAFYGCRSSLSQMIVKAITPPKICWYGLIKDNFQANAVIYVPDESVAAYKAAEGWSDLSTMIQPLSSLVQVGDKFQYLGVWYRITDVENKIAVVDGTDNKTYSGDANLVIPSEAINPNTNISYKVTQIENNAFKENTNITSLTIGENVTSIGDYAFYKCNKLTGTLTLPYGLQTIGKYAFCMCSGLTGELKIPNSVTSIGSTAFSSCSGFTGELIIPNKITSIQHQTFNACTKLTSVVIPESVTSIGSQAFAPNTMGVTGLTNITLLSSNPCEIGSHSSSNSRSFPSLSQLKAKNCVITVPCEAENTYETATNWSAYTDIIEGDFEYTFNVTSADAAQGTADITQKPTCSNNGEAKITATPAPNSNYEFDKWSDGNTEAERTIIVNTDMTLTAYFKELEGRDIKVTESTTLTELNSNYLCNIIVTEGATLTCDATETVANLTVENGAKLHVTNGATLTITNNLTAQSEGDVQPQILTESGSSISYGNFQFIKQIPATRYYFFSLPFTAENITIDGATAVYNQDWNFRYYDGAGFAQNPSNTSFWKVQNDGNMTTTQGYAVGVASSKTKYNRDLMFTTQQDIDFSLSEPRTIPVAENPIKESNTHPDKETFKGWNFIMNPYTSNFSTEVGTLIIENNVKVGYVTIPDEGTNKTYTQRLFSDIVLPPFFGFYVQVEKAGNVTFSPAGATSFNAPAASRTAQTAPRYVGVTLSNGEKYDETSLVIGKQFTSAYEIGSDLKKMLGYADKPQLYTYNGTTQYAFQSLNETAAAQVQPLGVYLPATGTYTFSLKESYDHSQVSAVYLYDYEANTVTNLKESDYTISSAQLNTEKRFAISVALAPSTTTALPSADSETAFSVWQDGTNRIVLDGVSAGDQVRVMDIQGKVVAQSITIGTTAAINLPSSGIYVVERTTAASVQVEKVVVR